MRRVKAMMLFIGLSSMNAQTAGFPVIDPANLIQNAANVFVQIKQIEQTAERIKYEVNAAKRLLGKMSKLDLTKINDLVVQINSFRNRARSIGYSYESIASQFDKTYGRQSEFSKNFKSWQKQSDDSLKDAMVSQGLLERSQKHMADLDRVIDEKRKAEGDADTLQAIGEINAIQSKQLADLSQIIATDARAKQSVVMEDRAKQKDLTSYENHLMKDFNKHGKSRPLTHFPSLGTTAPRH